MGPVEFPVEHMVEKCNNTDGQANAQADYVDQCKDLVLQ
jgi:hypothetical protein